jgi:SET domain-containing protein
MSTCDTNPLRLGRSPLSGRGVFAARDLPAETVVEVSPVLLLHRADGDHAGSLARYVFEWDEDADETAYAMALGWGSMFNHSGTPSCRYLRADDDDTIAGLVGLAGDPMPWAADSQLAPALVFVTNRAVRAGEELTIDYSGCGDDEFVFPE